MTAEELDRLLHDRFDVERADVIAALKLMPPRRPGVAKLNSEQALLLDRAGFADDLMAYAAGAVDAIAQMAQLISTAYSATDVASGLGLNQPQIRQRRRARSLWTIDDNGTWVYPKMQFEEVDDAHGRHTLRQVRGLDQVLPALPADVHPLAVAGFLLTSQPELSVGGRRRTVRAWLSGGGAVEPVFRLIEIGDWAAR